MAYNRKLNLIQNYGLTLLLVLLFASLCTAQNLPSVELTAMNDLSNGMNPSPWSGNGEPNPCLWEGVHCLNDGSNDRVDRLYMNFSSSYTIALSSTIGDLVRLTDLKFFNATFTTPLPSTLLQTQLQYIYFQNCDGVTFPTTGSSIYLTSIGINYSNITNMPDATVFPKLNMISMFEVNIDEAAAFIPPSYGSLVAGTISITNTNLGGTIPPELGNLKVGYLYIYGTQLTGPIPPQLGNISAVYLSLSGNQLNGTIPPELGNFQGETLSLSYNKLSGPLPSSLFNSKIVNLYVNDNLLTGPYPDTNSATSLQRLYISNNSFAPGPIPQSFYSLPSMTMFLASGCQFTGTIPIFTGKVDWLELANNQLTGTIPQFSQTSDLILVDVAGNSLTGVIPNFFLTSTKLQSLRLAGNSLAGCVTSSNFQQGAVNTCSMGGNVMCCPNNQTLPCDTELSQCLVCNTAKPSDNAICMYDETYTPVWLVGGSVVIQQNTTTGPIENTVIDGNLVTTIDVELNNVVINGNLSVVGQLTVSNGSISVRGCAFVNGSLVLNLTPSEAQALAANGTLERELITFDLACSTNDVNFDQIVVSGGVTDCAETTGKQQNTPGLVTILVTEQKLSCKSQEPLPSATPLPDWAIAVIVVGSVLVAGAIITGVLVSRHLRLQNESKNLSKRLNSK